MALRLQQEHVVLVDMRADRTAGRRERHHDVVDAPARQEAERRQQRGDVGVPLVDVLHQQRPVVVAELREQFFVERPVPHHPLVARRGRARSGATTRLLRRPGRRGLPARSAIRNRGTRCGSAAGASASNRAGIPPAACRAAAGAAASTSMGNVASVRCVRLRFMAWRSRRSRGRGTAAGTSRGRTDRPAARCAPSRLRAPRLPGSAPAATARISAASRSSTTTSHMHRRPMPQVVARRRAGADAAGRLVQQVDRDVRAEQFERVLAEAAAAMQAEGFAVEPLAPRRCPGRRC